MRKKQITCLLLALVMMLGLFAGCGGPQDSAGGTPGTSGGGNEQSGNEQPVSANLPVNENGEPDPFGKYPEACHGGDRAIHQPNHRYAGGRHRYG